MRIRLTKMINIKNLDTDSDKHVFLYYFYSGTTLGRTKELSLYFCDYFTLLILKVVLIFISLVFLNNILQYFWAWVDISCFLLLDQPVFLNISLLDGDFWHFISDDCSDSHQRVSLCLLVSGWRWIYVVLSWRLCPWELLNVHVFISLFRHWWSVLKNRKKKTKSSSLLPQQQSSHLQFSYRGCIKGPGFSIQPAPGTLSLKPSSDNVIKKSLA